MPLEVRFRDDYFKFLEQVDYDPGITIKDILENGVHFGHNAERWNPKMKPYIFGERNGIHIIDVQKTLELLTVACRYVYYVASNGGVILFVGTKNIGKDILKSYAIECEMPYVVERWLGGTLTNFQAILNGIERYNTYVEMVQSGEVYKLYTKKEANSIKRMTEKMGKYYEGIKNLKKLPDAVFVVGVIEEKTCIEEAVKMRVPIIAPVDTNCDPDPITFPFPGNDDGIRAVKLYCSVISRAIKVGRKRFLEQQRMITESGEQIQQAPS